MVSDKVKELKRYLGSSAAQKAIAWALLGITVLLVVAGILLSGSSSSVEPVEFYPGMDELKGKYVWIDVVGVTDWVYRIDSTTYYAVVDPEGYGYIVIMDDAQFASLKLYNDYWNTDGAEMPDPIRVCGVARRLVDDVADGFAQAFEFADAQQTRDTFGTYYCDMTSTPSGDKGVACFIAAFAAGIAAALMLLVVGMKDRTLKKCVKRLEELGALEDAAAQLTDAENEMLGGDSVRLGRDYLFCRATGAVLAYKDILWTYVHVTRTYFVVTSESLVANTPTMRGLNAVNAGNKRQGGGTDALNRVMQVIAERNPEVLIGYTGQNAKAYKEKVAALKSGAAL